MGATAKTTSARPGAAVPGWPPKRVALAAIAVFLFASALYLPTLRNAFVWDDLAFIENPDIKTLDATMVEHLFASNYWEFEEVNSGLYRPLSALSMHTDDQLYGESAAGFHFTNVLLNAAVCTLLFLVLWCLFARADVALMAAFFFAAFPTHVENVAWVSGRTDLIATLLMLAALWCYIVWRQAGNRPALIGVPLCFAGALLSKETAVILPAVAALVEWGVLARPRAQRSRWPGAIMLALLFAMAALYFALRAHVLGAAISHFPRFTTGAVQAVALSFSILAHYTYKLLYPLRLSAETDFLPPARFLNMHTLVGIAIVVAAGLALRRWRRDDAVVFAMGVLAIGLAPVLNILPVNQVTAERFLYFPSIGFALLVSLAARAAMARWRPIVFVFGAIVLLYSARTVLRTFDWKDDLTLFQKTVAANGDSARARANLGATYYRRERYQEAATEYRRATEINPGYAAGWNGLAKTAGKLGHVDEAMDYMEKAIALKPDDALMYNGLGILEFQAQDYAGAEESFRHALELRPRHRHARFNLGLALYQQRDFDGAIREFTTLENKDTDFVNAYFFIAESESQRGRSDEARRAATHFLSLYKADDAMAKRARQLASP